MESQKSPGEGLSVGLVGALPYLSLLALGLTLAIYPTNLNPGLPLVLSGSLAVLYAVCRALFGSGKYYHPAHEVVVGLYVWLGLSLLVHRTDLYFGEKSLWTFLGGVVFFGSCQVGIRHSKQARRSVIGFMVLVALICLAAWVEELPRALHSGSIENFKGRFFNPDTFALVPLAGMCLGMGLLERMSRKWLSWYTGFLSFLLTTMLVTGCRAAVLGVLVGGAVFVGLVKGYRQREFDKTRYLLMVPIVVGLMGLAISAFNSQALTRYVTTLTHESGGIGETRSEVNAYGWLAMLKNPVLGGGPGSFGLLYQSVRPRGHDYLYVDIAHNDYIEMGVESGLIGLVAWCAIFYFCLNKLYRCVRKGKRPFLAAGVAASISAMMTFSLVNFILPERPVLWLMMFVLGLAASFPASRIRYEERVYWRYLSSVLIGLGGVASVWFGVNSVRAEYLLAESRQVSSFLVKEEALRFQEQAISLQPYRASGYLEAATLARSIGLIQGDPNWVKREEQFLLRAHQVSPQMVEPLSRLVDFYQRQGMLDKAREYLNKALALTPYRHDLLRKAALLAFLQKDYKTAMVGFAELVSKVGVDEYKQLRGLLWMVADKEPITVAVQFKNWRADTAKSVWLGPMVAELLDKSLAQKKWNQVDLFLSEALFYSGEDLCLKFKAAAIKGARFGAAQELNALKPLVNEASSLKGDCSKKAVARYVELLESVEGSAQAESFLKARIREFPRLQGYRLWLASLYKRQKAYRKGEKVLRDGLSAGINSANVMLELGVLYELNGSRELAATYYRQALQEEPGLNAAREGLARVAK